MNSSSTPESGPYSTNQRPYFYARATAQQPFPNPWFLGPMYNPYSMPTTGFRSGNPYYPFYSVPFHEYSGYLVQQPPMHMRVNRRPYFNGHPPSSPMFYQATRFRHYSPGKRTETKETQTDPKQLENKQKKHQDHGIETKGRDAANVTCFPSVGKGAESCMEKSDRTVSPTIPEREFPKSPAGSVQFRSLPPPGYAFEKEEVRIEYANGGAPAIQLWKSFKETIPLYDVAKKAVPENIMQRDVFALSACEGVIYGPHEQREMVPGVPYSEEQKALVDVQEKEQLSSLDSEKDRAKSSLDETKSAQLTEPTRLVAELHQLGVRQDAQMPKRSSGFKRSSGPKAPQDVSNLVQQREYFPSGMEIANDSSYPQKLTENHEIENHEMTNDHQVSVGSLWCDESEKYIPPDSWLACLDNMDTNCNYNMYLSQRKRPSVLSLTSDEMSSVDEASVTDKTPVSYFAPDYMLQKNMYAFKKSPEGLERERIKSGGSLNEDEMVEGEQPYTSNSHSKSCSRVKIKDIYSHGKKLGILARTATKKLYSRKASKSLSPSEAEESDEYWVKQQEEEEEDDDDEEEEYLIQGVAPYGTLSPSKSGLYRQIGQQVFWRIPKNAVPTQLISCEKIKTSSPTKLKGQEQDEDLCGDYSFCLKRPSMQLEVLEHRKTPHKFSGRLQKEDGEMVADEYWMKSGARPKFASLRHGGLFPLTKSREKDNLLVDMSKKKGARKPPHKRRDTRHDAEELEEWEKPKTTQHKARGPKRSLYKRR